ncbi:MAG: 3'-5' exonuclease, partial [Kiloniellales bacterium]|nr:3'-5' exonuclease [Kiloniellales bacterium]
DDMPLERLPSVVFDCETTGLDVTRDRMISIGAVRLQGSRIFHGETLDRLVDPGVPIPARSRAVHGITDNMVAGQPKFEMIESQFRHFTEGCVLIGHNVPFDIAILRREYELAGLKAPAFASLDLLQLVSVLDPQLTDASLDKLAAYWGVEIRGRHTALGDSLVTAELYRLLLPRLASEGVETFGQVREFCSRAKDVIRRQKEMGW